MNTVTLPILRLELVKEGELEFPSPNGGCLKDSALVALAMRPRLASLAMEELWLIALDIKHHPRGLTMLSRGDVDSAAMLSREIFAAALGHCASSIILCHNHPSGDPAPSPEDMTLTRRLREAGEIIGIRVLDHVIVGATSHYSFVDAGAF